MSVDNYHGHDNSSRFEISQDDGRTPLALAAGLAAGLVSGAAWAGIVLLTNREIGYAAWGIGLFVGLAMSRATVRRSKQLAYAAALFATFGLFVGKAVIVAGSSSMIAKELEADADVLSGVLAWQMYEGRELHPPTLAAVDSTKAAGDTLSDALWAEMRTQASARLQEMNGDEKHEVAAAAAESFTQDMTLSAGIQSQLSLFDLLWLFLAVGTAFRMMSPAANRTGTEATASI